MSRPTGVFKKDKAARDAWGAAYDAIPKSVFALVAWHLANVASDSADSPGAAETRFAEEIQALGLGGHLDKAQALAAIKELANFSGGVAQPDAVNMAKMARRFIVISFGLQSS